VAGDPFKKVKQKKIYPKLTFNEVMGLQTGNIPV